MKKEFIEFVASIMEMDISEVSMSMSYKDTDKWDSLMMLTLIMELEAKYGVTIPIEKIDNINMLEDLYKLVV